MSPPLSRRVLTGCVLIAALVLPLLGAALADEAGGSDATASKQESEPPRKSRKQELAERRMYAIKPRTGKVFEKTKEHINAERFGEAEAALGKLNLGRLSPYERAQAQRLYGYAAYGRQDNDAAIDHLSKALAEDILPPADHADVLYQIAQIQAAERRWKDVIATLEAWFKIVERPNSVAYFLMALSHFQLEDLDAALLPAKKAVEIAKVPQQAWLQLLLAIHLTRKDYAAATPVAVELVTLYPNSGKGYWLQLSALYGVRGDTERALGILEIAYRKALLTEDPDLRRLLQLMLFQGIPYRAANILEQELAEKRVREDAESLELLSNSWILAREVAKAQEPLARAAGLSSKGDLYVRLAQVHLLQEEWSDAAAVLREALAKGNLADPGGVQLLLGITYYNDKNLQEARSWFARAQQSGATRQQAATWIEHVDREIESKRSGAETPS